MKLPRYYGETSNGWVISEPFTMTNRAKYAFKIERGSQISLIENRKGDFYYMFSYDTSMLPPTVGRDSYLVSIKGKGVKKALGLQGCFGISWARAGRRERSDQNYCVGA